MSWAAKRQILIVLFVLIVAGLGVFLFVAPKIFVAPTCSDGKQNADERGVDCGGSCRYYCAMDTKTPTVLWTRSFEVTQNIHNAVAYIENRNAGAIRALPYEFRFYDDRGVYIGRRQGKTIVPPNGRFAIVETAIPSGEVAIAKTTFEFGESATPWEVVPDRIRELRITTGDVLITTPETTPRMMATLTNVSPIATLNNITVAVILYDAQDNAINVSRTIVPMLTPLQSTQVFFTWPKPFESEVIRYEIIPLIDVFATST